MYVIDARHYLNDKGNIAAERGAARKMADFMTSVVAHASDFDRPDNTPGHLPASSAQSAMIGAWNRRSPMMGRSSGIPGLRYARTHLELARDVLGSQSGHALGLIASIETATP